MSTSTNKVRVVSVFGAGAAFGLMDPKVGMRTHLGTIASLASGNYQVTISGGGPGSTSLRYPHELQVLLSHASGTHAWPTGDGSVLFGHHDDWPSGAPRAVASGMVYCKGKDDAYTFYR
jgi:hypothetical protein